MQEIYEKIIKNIEQSRVLKDELMSKHTSFKIGGPADIFIKINNIEELKYILKLVKDNNIDLTIIGNGTNLLVRDKGIRGITIKLNLDNIKVQDELIEAEAGVLITKIARIAYENSLSGLEFASGIPGTIGGATKMNAGAYGGEFKDIVLETTYMDKELILHTISNEAQQFSYRDSIFNKNEDYIIISTKLKLHKTNKEEIKNKMDENSLKRKEKQPINLPNAGSVFKRKNQFIPAQIIDKCGLKGYNIGGACISNLHAGFIVNEGNATATDVIILIEHIKAVVKKEYNEDLNVEIKIIGEE